MRVHKAKTSTIVGFTKGENSSKAQSQNTKISSDENQCKVCNKGFSNNKALDGHMRHHSKTERAHIFCEVCGKGFVSLKALYGHMRCHSALMRKKRSRTMEYESISNSLVSGFNSDMHDDFADDTIIGDEIEEVAMILIMLSMGSYDSVVDRKLSIIDKSVAEKGGGSLVCDDFVFNSNAAGDQLSDNGGLDSTIVIDGVDMVKLEETVDGLSVMDELEKPHSGKVKEEQTPDQTSSQSTKLPHLRKKPRVDAYDFDENNACDKGEYKCTTCYMNFSSHQALGGHRSSAHRAVKSSSLSNIAIECAKPNVLINNVQRLR